MKIDISIEQVKRLCRVTGISVDRLLRGDTTQEDVAKIKRALIFVGVRHEETRYRKRRKVC
jgi:nitrogenase molybdenum-iron protein alpha/beta subunit